MLWREIMKIKINYENESLFCCYSKERIELGEKYVEIEEEYGDEIIKKVYKLEYCPEENEEDDIYISEENSDDYETFGDNFPEFNDKEDI